MPDRIQAAKVLCQGGLNKNDNSFLLSAVSPGSGASLINYETNQSGGYRRINGYSKLSASFAEVTSAGDPAEGKVLGIWVFYNNTSEEYEYIAARKLTSGNTYKFYLYNASTGWSAFSTGMTHTYSTDIYRVRGLSFNFGIGNHMVFVDGVNKAVIYNGTNWYALDSTNTGGTGDPGGDQVVDDPIVARTSGVCADCCEGQEKKGDTAHLRPSLPRRIRGHRTHSCDRRATSMRCDGRNARAAAERVVKCGDSIG